MGTLVKQAQNCGGFPISDWGASQFPLYLLDLFLHVVGLLPDPFQGPHFPSHRVNPSDARQPSIGKFGGVLDWIESADIFDLL
jgi:hypothetical protein